MSPATCDLCGTPLGPHTWTTLCGADCVDAFVAAGHAAPARPTGQFTLEAAFDRAAGLARSPVRVTLDAFAKA